MPESVAPPAPGLYVVATPIGNLGDLSPRATRLLATADVIAAEDTRTSGSLVRRLGATARLVSLTEHNVAARAPGLIDAARTSVVALVSDAGTPAISDPGARLVALAHAEGVAVVAVPGPSALAAALSVSGFQLHDVLFLGFLPTAAAQRAARLKAAAGAASVIALFESPGRLARTLEELAGLLRDPEAVVCRELTKLHEEVVRGRASELAGRFAETKGECTVVVDTSGFEPATADDDLEQFLAAFKRAGARRAPAAAEAARRFGVPKERAYALWESV